MAEYDGSVRIGVKLDLDNAEKQLEHLKNRMAGQVKEIEKQAQAVNKLKAEYDKLLGETAEPKAIRSIADNIAKTKEEAMRLEEELSRLSSLEAGDVSPETIQQIQTLKEQISAADERTDQLKQNLIELSVSPEMMDKIEEMATSLRSADSELEQMRASAEQTKTEIGSTGQQIDQFNGYLRDIRENAEVSDQGIIDMTNRLEELKKHLADLEAAGLSIGFKDYDETIAEIRNVEEELRRYKNSLGEADEAGGKTSWISKLGGAMKRVGAAIGKTTKAAGTAVGGLKKRIAALGREKGFDKAGQSVQRFATRLKSIVAGALVFNVISRGLTALTKKVGEYLLANKQFADSLGRIKSNLLTAFQPIYEAVMPALNTLMAALDRITAQFAAFVAGIFGTTASKAQANAKALNEQAEATEEAGDAAKKAEKEQKKYFASFDTIQQLGEKQTEEKEDKKKDKDEEKAGEAKFDTDYSKVEPPKWLMDFWKPFQESWDQYGATTIQSFKDALGAILLLLGTIGATFLAVWTSGAGVETLNDLQILLQTILGIIRDIALAFVSVWNNGTGEQVIRSIFTLLNSVLTLIISIGQTFSNVWNNGAGEAAIQAILNLLNTVLSIISAIAQAFTIAWNSGTGEAVIQNIFYALTAVLNLLNSIGQAFIQAWNDNGRGVEIFRTIQQIIANIFETVGNLAERFRTAWEANQNGKAIWAAILDIIQSVLDLFQQITAATAQWASGLELEPIVSGFRQILETIQPLVDILLNGLAWAWENILLPLSGWVIEDAAPAAINVLVAALEALNNILEVIGPLFEALWNGILKPLASFIGGAFVAALNALAAAIQAIGDLLTGLISTLSDAASKVAEFFGASGSAKSASYSSYGGSGRMASPRSISEGDMAKANFAAQLSNYSIDDLPHLANGGVIAPNNEFLAVLGDQRSGTNVETPLSTMKQAFLEAISESGLLDRQGGGGGVAEMVLDGQKFARLIQPYTSGESGRLGVDLVMGGA